MSSVERYTFGVKAGIFYDIDTFAPLGIFRVIRSAEYTKEVEAMPLTGGHRNGAWAIEQGEITHSLVMTIAELPNFLLTQLNQGEATDYTGEDTSGSVGTIANKDGTSVVDATTGIASVALISGSGAKLPVGKVVVKATSATQVSVYALGDVASGAIPVTDELPLLASGVTIANSGATVDLADYGLRFTSGSGTIAMTTGDTAYFETRPANSKTTKISMADSNSEVKYVGVILVYPKNAAKKQRIVEFFKVGFAGGLPLSANTREFSELEITATPLLDDDDQVMEMTEVQCVS